MCVPGCEVGFRTVPGRVLNYIRSFLYMRRELADMFTCTYIEKGEQLYQMFALYTFVVIRNGKCEFSEITCGNMYSTDVLCNIYSYSMFCGVN